MKLNCTRITLTMVFALLATFVFAQVQSPLDLALRHVEENYADWGLSKTDVENMYVSDMYVDKKTGISRVFFQQRHQNVKLNQAILNLSINKDGKVFFVGKRFVPNLNLKANAATPALTAEQAVNAAFAHLELNNTTLRQTAQGNDQLFTFTAENFVKEAINVELQYQKVDEQTVRLAWDMVIDPKRDNDKWSMRIDATTGAVLAQENWTIYCRFEHDHFHNHDAACRETAQAFGGVDEALNTQAAAYALTDDAQYNVFAMPLESPAHGDRSIVQNPSDVNASPYGWHDTDGVDGPEYTITRGNNVWAYQDRSDSGSSSGDEPDGGADLIFDFAYDANDEPDVYVDAATTNLFYMANIVHDFSWVMGFDEAAGNFQTNNYGNGGAGGDALIARAQAAADAGSENNAFYTGGSDGQQASINMFVWNRNVGGGEGFLDVTAPDNISGTYPTSAAGDWGAPVTTTPVSGQVVIVNDGVYNPYDTDACEEIINGADLDGKIALIDRGGCEFGFKAFSAQQQGAIGVIICNFDPDPVGMAGGAFGGQVNIPVLMIGSGSCAQLRQFADGDLEVNIVSPPIEGPDLLDGDFDNGIIAHEFGHGVSIRATGGGNQNCLGNTENMGEGWSDYLGIALSVRDGDTGDMRRGVGTYVTREPNDGRGIRRYPYSTDMTINPLTYGDVAGNTQTHAVGEVWCAMVWDLHWALADEYGLDLDLINGTGGNNIANNLIIEALKIQPCAPGFVDGRDAILAADEALYDGANQCLIWEVFARRGCGFYADQGSSVAGDETEDFEPRPTCVEELKIKKTATPLVDAGENYTVTIEIINHKPETLTGVTVTDMIPAGCSFVAGSGSITPTVTGDMLSFDLGTMAYEDETTLTYEISTPADEFSIRQYYYDVEDQNIPPSYVFDVITDGGNSWASSDIFANSGNYSFFVEDVLVESQQALLPLLPFSISGDNPTLRFYHRYDTEAGADAGLIEYSTDGNVWFQMTDGMFRGVTDGSVQYATFVVPNIQGFSGNSGGWKATYIDLDDLGLNNSEISLRWRFGTDENTGGLGWNVDDIEILDLVNYNSEACVTSDQNDEACSEAPERGTVIESQIVDATFEPLDDNLGVAIYPNPASDIINVHLNTTETVDATIALYSVDGKQLRAANIRAYGETNLPVNVQDLTAGFYFVKVTSNGHTYTEKVVIKK